MQEICIDTILIYEVNNIAQGRWASSKSSSVCTLNTVNEVLCISVEFVGKLSCTLANRMSEDLLLCLPQGLPANYFPFI